MNVILFHPPVTMTACFTVSHAKIYSSERDRRGGMHVITCGLVYTDISGQAVSSIINIIWTETRNDVAKISCETSVNINISTWLFTSGDTTREPRILHYSADNFTVSKIKGTCRILKEHKIKTNRYPAAPVTCGLQLTYRLILCDQ
jgi:hypothetical protein